MGGEINVQTSNVSNAYVPTIHRSNGLVFDIRWCGGRLGIAKA